MIVNRRYADAATGRPRRSRSNGGCADVGATGPVRDLIDDGFSDRRAAKAAESSEKETDLNPADRALDYFSLESPIDSDRDGMPGSPEPPMGLRSGGCGPEKTRRLSTFPMAAFHTAIRSPCE